MEKRWMRAIGVAVLVLVVVSVCGASEEPGSNGGQGSGSEVQLTTLKGYELYEGPQLPYLTRESWFDFTVQLPVEPSLPIVARELHLKQRDQEDEGYAFFEARSVARPDDAVIVAVPIMNLDVFGKLGLGHESLGREIFSDPVIVDLSEAFLLERTGLDELPTVYFVYHRIAYTAKEFEAAGNIEILDAAGGLRFRIVDWPVDDLMLIGEGQ